MRTNSAVKGELTFVVNEGSTSEKSLTFPNLILDQGLKQLAGKNVNNGQWPGGYLYVGTGTSAPSNEQTELSSFIAKTARTSQDFTVPSVSNGWTQVIVHGYKFDKGAVIGNITEVGMGWYDTTGSRNLLSRTLVADSSGNPVALTLTSIDQLTVYYKITQVPNLNVTNGTLTLGSTNYPYTLCRVDLSSAATILSNSNDSAFRASSTLSMMLCYSPKTPAEIRSTLLNTSGRTDRAMTYYVSTSTSNLIAGTSFSHSLSPDEFSMNTTISMGPDFYISGGGQIRPITHIMFSVGGGNQWTMVFDTPIDKNNTNTLSFTINNGWTRV